VLAVNLSRFCPPLYPPETSAGCGYSAIAGARNFEFCEPNLGLFHALAKKAPAAAQAIADNR
jgi:hypothetical protein